MGKLGVDSQMLQRGGGTVSLLRTWSFPDGLPARFTGHAPLVMESILTSFDLGYARASLGSTCKRTHFFLIGFWAGLIINWVEVAQQLEITCSQYGLGGTYKFSPSGS
jgi:hypothetical protein